LLIASSFTLFGMAKATTTPLPEIAEERLTKTRRFLMPGEQTAPLNGRTVLLLSKQRSQKDQ
jgi:hypothetical protein